VVTYTQGPVVAQVQRVWPQATQTIRLYNNADYLEVEHTLQPIDFKDGVGKEVIIRYDTTLSTQGLWYTDAQGIEFQERKFNFRPTWTLNVTEPVAGNYYPVNFATYIKDTTANQQFTILTDRTRSAASLVSGQLESMLYRRCLKDDGRGVAEALNETYVVTEKEWLIFESPASSAASFRPKAKILAHPPIALFGVSDNKTNNWQGNTLTYSPLATALPQNVQLLTLNTYQKTILLRLHHIFQIANFSSPSRRSQFPFPCIDYTKSQRVDPRVNVTSLQAQQTEMENRHC